MYLPCSDLNKECTYLVTVFSFSIFLKIPPSLVLPPFLSFPSISLLPTHLCSPLSISPKFCGRFPPAHAYPTLSLRLSSSIGPSALSPTHSTDLILRSRPLFAIHKILSYLFAVTTFVSKEFGQVNLQLKSNLILFTIHK